MRGEVRWFRLVHRAAAFEHEWQQFGEISVGVFVALAQHGEKSIHNRDVCGGRGILCVKACFESFHHDCCNLACNQTAVVAA